jgi:ribonuclease HII
MVDRCNIRHNHNTIIIMPHTLYTQYTDDPDLVEIGVDEVGRGPLFGRVYVAAAILPKSGASTSTTVDTVDTLHTSFDHTLMKDSKRFTSQKRLSEAYDHVLNHCIDYEVSYESETTVDNINILQSTQRSMHTCVQALIERNNLVPEHTVLLIDGNYFKPHTRFDKETGKWACYDHVCVKGGDNMYTCIAAASIVAKVERDKYIADLCAAHPDLDDKYSIASNKGYGAKKHLEGIRSHGITQWHRKTFGICKGFV